MKCQSGPYSLSPLSASSQRLLRSPHKATRKISRIPFKVLDAPELQDDFYLNLVDWSVQNVLSVGLGSCVYLWSACTSQVTRLCDLSSDANVVTSVSWSERGNLVAVGTHNGYVTVWDVTVNKQVNKLMGHSARVGALAWNGDVLSSGSRDRMILQRDTRTPPNVTERRLIGHRQEVCGLKWSPDNQYLASGGNDNRLYVWNMQSLSPVQTYTDHLAAVKAIAWSPHHHGLLASGGGTADRCIRFWNTLTGQPMQCVDTGRVKFILTVLRGFCYRWKFFAALNSLVRLLKVWICSVKFPGLRTASSESIVEFRSEFSLKVQKFFSPNLPPVR
uniref:CDC20/Fizzy WD40 domain-containing protein n=1 Tax=Dendroctonus ponderosae TaxID=77166 RepID=A0AAR5Q258_DENPD